MNMEIGKEWTGQNEKDDELFRIIKAMFSRYYNRNLLTEAGQNNFIKLRDDVIDEVHDHLIHGR